MNKICQTHAKTLKHPLEPQLFESTPPPCGVIDETIHI